MAYQRGRDDYAAIRDEANDPMTLAVEVTEELHDDMLGCVPPIYVTGGFLVGECITSDSRGEVFAHFAERDGRFYARYSVLGDDATLIPLVLSPVEAKRATPITLKRMGDFYEAFNDDAKAVAKVLDIALTTRAIGGLAPVPMCGIPAHALSRDTAVLQDAGFTVITA